MYVVLVDDEQWIVAGLKKILEKNYSDMTIRCFTDPLVAIQSMKEDLPDLLITDIRMPQLSGMELIAQMREAGLRYYAVLTGLNDIQLLQESIRIQVSDYLIKPVNKAELFALIERVTKQIDEQKRQQEAYLTDQLRLCAQYGAQAVDVSLLKGFRSMMLVSEECIIPQDIRDFIAFQVKLNHFGQEYFLYLFERDVKTIAEKATTCGMARAFVADFVPERLNEQLSAFDTDQDDELGRLARQFAAGAMSEEELQRLQKLLRESRDAPLLLNRFCKLAGRMLPLWEACCEAATAAADGATADAFGQMLESASMLPAPKSADVLTVLAWIEQHYREEITLSQAAALVYLQANYFTTLFKKEMGIGFVQYLNQFRVEAACRMILADGEVSFAQIAQDSGFTSTRHFFATFKKYTGQTPGAFRQMMEDAGFTGN